MPPGGIEQIVWIERIRKTRGIEAFAIITDGHSQGINSNGEPDLDWFLRIVFIAAQSNLPLTRGLPY